MKAFSQMNAMYIKRTSKHFYSQLCIHGEEASGTAHTATSRTEELQFEFWIMDTGF